MNGYEALFNTMLGLALLGALIAGIAYALMYAAGVDAPLPVRPLRTVWRVAVWFVTGFVLAGLFLGSLLLNVAACAAAEIGLHWILALLGLWVVGSVVLISSGKPRRVVPYLFAATGLGYVSAVSQAILSLTATEIAMPPQLPGLPIFIAYLSATGLLLHGLMQPNTEQVVRWLTIGAFVSLISGSLVIGPAALLKDTDGNGYGVLLASLIWSATALSVWSAGTAALLTAGRGTGAVVGFLLLATAVYLAVLFALIGAAGAPGAVLGALALAAVNCAAVCFVLRVLPSAPPRRPMTESFSPAS